ncbi:MAG: hypothetical protein H6739_32390 [Alphaproteobacteria bacterium]|nr:hypothetical protein [Alphaproteobacteria bacterium]
MASAQGVLLLDLSDAPEEDRFHQELALTLDDVRLQPTGPGFVTAPLAAQLDVARPLLEDEAVQAVAWLDATDPAQLRVSVAFVAEDRAVVRLLEVPREPGAEARLALATRELLAEAYQLEDLPPPPPPPPPPEAPPEPSWAWTAGGSLTWPPQTLAGGLRPGLGAAVERRAGPLWLGLGVEVQLARAHWRVGPGLSARWGPVSLGVRADRTALAWQTVWQPRVTAGLSHRFAPGPMVGLELALTPLRDEVLDGEEVLYNSGWIELGVKVGWSRKVGGG